MNSIIKSYVEQGLFKAGEFKAADISTTNTIYQELDRYRQQAQGDIAKLKDATGQAAEFRDAAQKHFDAFNFLDASRYAAAGVKAH